MLSLRVRVNLGNDDTEGVHRITQSPSITETSPSDCLELYPVDGGVTPLQRRNQCTLQPQLRQYSELNVKTVLFQTIHFSISTQFNRQSSPISIFDSRSGGVLPFCREAIGVFFSPSWLGNGSYGNYCILTIRLFSVISRTLVGEEGLPLCRDVVGVFYIPPTSWLGWVIFSYIYSCC